MFELIQQTDFRILDWIQSNLRSPWLDWLAPKITFLCEKGWFWILLTLVFLVWKKHRRCGITMLIGLILGVVIGLVLLKPLVARPRPCWINQEISLLITSPKDYSFPSGHSLFSFVTSVILLLYDRRMGIPAVILAALIALSRLYLYVHFPTDVLAGTLLGILMAFLATRIMHHFSGKTFPGKKKEEDSGGNCGSGNASETE